MHDQLFIHQPESKTALMELIRELLKESDVPLTVPEIADALKQHANIGFPSPIYNPANNYDMGQKVFHASLKYEGWFEVISIVGNRMDVRFENGGQVNFQKEMPADLLRQMQFPINEKAYLMSKLEAILQEMSGVYHLENYWHDQPIVKPIVQKTTPSSKQVGERENFAKPPPPTSKPQTRKSRTRSLEEIKTICKQYQISCFYHITHIENLENILRVGILCNKKAPCKKDISDPEIQNTRDIKRIPISPFLTIHDCVPLFFSPLSPMLSSRRQIQGEIVYLHIDTLVLALPHVVFTDGNARSNKTHFYSSLEDFKRLDWEILRARYWNDYKDHEINKENRRLRSAEVLVPEHIPTNLIKSITVMHQGIEGKVRLILKNVGLKLTVSIDKAYYFPFGF